MDEPTLDKFPKKALANIGVERAFIVSRLIVAAESLQVFRLLQRKHMKADAIGRALKIHKFYLKAFLNSLASLGLLSRANDIYWNTPLAENYFIGEDRHDDLGRAVVLFPRTFPATGADAADLTFP